MVGLWLLPAIARANPTFQVIDLPPSYGPFADAAWAAGIVCVGREPVAAPVVRIDADPLVAAAGKSYGRGAIDLERIRINPPDASERVLGGWTPHGYAFSHALVTAFAREIPLADLFPAGGFDTWAMFDQRFRGRSRSIDALLDLARTLPPAVELWDTDGDGLPSFYESVSGTDPRRADSDGDGLVDGLQLSSHPSSAHVLPADGMLHCVGWVHGPRLRGLDALGAWKGDRLPLVDAEPRLVRGVGEQMLFWPDEPTVHADSSCIEGGPDRAARPHPR